MGDGEELADTGNQNPQGPLPSSAVTSLERESLETPADLEKQHSLSTGGMEDLPPTSRGGT